MPIGKVHLYSRATVEKYKVMKSQSRKLFRRVIAIIALIGAYRSIGAAGRVAGHEDDHGHATGSEDSE